MIFWLLLLLTTSQLPSIPPFPGHLALGREEGTVAWEVPSSLLLQRRSGSLPLVSLPTPRKKNKREKFVADGHPGSGEICFGLSTCTFFPWNSLCEKNSRVFFACGVKTQGFQLEGSSIF